jgi:hypothetical protein
VGELWRETLEGTYKNIWSPTQMRMTNVTMMIHKLTHNSSSFYIWSMFDLQISLRCLWAQLSEWNKCNEKLPLGYNMWS